MKKEKLKSEVKEKNGITLIALVITVVVMLILAGVVISSIIGENNLFSKIGNAKNIYENESLKEANLLTGISDEIEDQMYGKVEKVSDTNPGILEGEGTETNPFVINSIEDLVAFSENVKNGITYENQYVKLGLSLNFNSTKSYVDYARKDFMGYGGELKKALTTESGFKGIGTNMTDDEEGINSFKGNFDGNNNKIINLYMNINNEEQWTRAGLFGNNCGFISNIELVNCNITGMVTGSNSVQCGGIVGHNFGDLSNCIVRGKIYGINQGTNASYLGGISAYNDGSIIQCSNYAEFDFESNEINNDIIIGGIAGGGSNIGSIVNSYNYSKIEYENKFLSNDIVIGGILGYGGNLIENSSNFSNINIDKIITKDGIYMGGIIGYNNNNSNIINRSFNKGNLICSNSNSKNLYVGGIAGQSNQVNNCYNLGNIESLNNNLSFSLIVGGIAGVLKSNICQNSYNIGNINIHNTSKCSVNIGGIIGVNNNIIDKCYNFSEKIKVNSLGENYVGGITGYNNNIITNSYNKFKNLQNIGIEVSGKDAVKNYTGGISGTNRYNASISNSKNDVKIISENGKINNMGGICGYNGSSAEGENGVVLNCEYRIYTDLNYNAIGVGALGENITGSEDYVVTEKIIDVINGDNMFKEDLNNINNGYPILIWQ